MPYNPLPDDRHRRRWNVIMSGLLIGTLALIVTFTNRAAFLSPTAVVVVAAVGLVALMLQLRFRYGNLTGVRAPAWCNVLGTIFALAAFLGDRLHLRGRILEVLALLAVGCFGISGGIVLHTLRKRRAGPK
jgi:drug/metabolite transporter (DMT)-like permease